MKTTALDVIEHLQKTASAAGFGGMFNSNITSPIALGMLAAPSIYHMATGKHVSDTTDDLAETGGLGLLVHGELPAMAHAIATRGRV